MKNHSLSNNVTLVTAFFDIGTLVKGNENNVRSPSKYKEWMSIFRYIENPLYAYVDTIENLEAFKEIRQPYINKTKVILIDKNQLWGFNLKENISQIFSSPFYPKYYPNTVNPDYSCAMHAKYGVMNQSIYENAFRTKYFAWVDVGYFSRSINDIHSPFGIHLPYKFHERKVSFGEVYKPMRRTLKQIIENNEIWVAGGFFLANVKVMKKWVEDYMYYTKKFIELGLISTDQQVIYGLMQPSVQKSSKFRRRRVDINEYTSSYDKWYALGYNCTYNLNVKLEGGIYKVVNN